MYKNICIGIIFLVVLEFILGFIFKCNINKLQNNLVSFTDIIKVIGVSIIIFIVINIVSIIKTKVGLKPISKILRNGFFLVLY